MSKDRVQENLPENILWTLEHHRQRIACIITIIWWDLCRFDYQVVGFLFFFKERDNAVKMVCSRTPTSSRLWFVPSPGAGGSSFYHLWNHPVYGWDVTTPPPFLFTREVNLLYFDVIKWTCWWGVHPVLWACSLCSAAPEVLSGGPYNHAADWWSLGILLFSLVTGKVRSLLLLSWRTVSFKSVWRVFFFKAILMQQKMKAELIIAESF